MLSLRKAILMATVTAFVAQPILALTVQQTNVSDGGGVFVPAIIVTDGLGAGTYRIGDSGLTRNIMYNEDDLKAWAAQLAGVAESTITIYDLEKNATQSDDCDEDASFDAESRADTLIYIADQTQAQPAPQGPSNPCKDIPPPPCISAVFVPNAADHRILIDATKDCMTEKDVPSENG